MRSKTTTSGKVRGFTLIELMVVVVIIAILAVIAVPLFSARLQGRRIFQVAGRVADLYRGSRTRALARGSAVLVQLNPATATLTVLEGVQGTAASLAAGTGKATCGNLPARGCLTNDWSNVGAGAVIGTARFIDSIANQPVVTGYTIGTGTRNTTATVSLCFSPAGRTFVNTTGTWTAASWQQLTGPIVIDVATKPSPGTPQRTYNVIVMPNGTSRLAL